MADTFLQRIPTLAEPALRAYLDRPGDYRPEAVRAAAEELRRRGRGPTEAEWQALEAALAPAESSGPDPRRLRALARWTLILGLGTALLIYATAKPAPPDPLGYDPLDTKRYLRELEVFGGKANILATQFRQWFEGLWEGRNLAYTVATLTGLLAGLLRFLGREPRA
ncbi:hypothetical protein GETHPA_14360 [Geothrix rubra]|uniref:Uncharacterized protein n=1 Tax=Geothrix rubra TaxID=2927977 RepID=A0ABQ5Q5K2_9BACT|nr:hypothetical protein [Geothrix rubra]GLH69903.1 hypothetical protein GETHPA_14360 [Geothrix rubra]